MACHNLAGDNVASVITAYGYAKALSVLGSQSHAAQRVEVYRSGLLVGTMQRLDASRCSTHALWCLRIDGDAELVQASSVLTSANEQLVLSCLQIFAADLLPIP
jgi:hypothetical protein